MFRVATRRLGFIQTRCLDRTYTRLAARITKKVVGTMPKRKSVMLSETPLAGTSVDPVLSLSNSSAGAVDLDAVNINALEVTGQEEPEELDATSQPAKKRRRTVKAMKEGAGVDVSPMKKGQKQATAAVFDESLEHSSIPEKKRRAAKPKADVIQAGTSEPGLDELTTSTPAKKRRTKKQPAESTATPVHDTQSTPSRRSTRPRKAISRAVVDEEDIDELDEDDAPKKRAPRRKKAAEPVVYVIPEVERKETTFRGRLGYACLNTVLRAQKPESVFCSRTCRLDTIAQKGLDFAKDLGLRNAQDLYKMIEWNEENKIRFMRISSEMFPFASHSLHGYSLEYAQAELQRAGELANRLGHRLTMHPGQFTQLGSPKDGVVEASVRELNYQCEILDRMCMPADSVMIIHMGGVYNDKLGTIARFRENYTTKLSESVKRRLVLENDELCYNLDDLLPVSEELGIPLVIDYHHDWIYPSSRSVGEIIPLVNAVWHRKGIKPKQHLSEPRPGAVTPIEKRAHADRCKSLPADLPDDMDLMIEAKDKEQAVFELWRIYGLETPIHENLRPPADVQELATKGRKSRVRKKKMGAEDGGEEVTLKEVEKEGDERVLVENAMAEDEGEESELSDLEEA